MMAASQAEVDRMLANYRELIHRFIAGESNADDFERDFLRTFKNDTNQIPSTEFEVLDSLFADVDDYVADQGLREQVGGLDAEELRARARNAYQRLYP
ncbi:colicin immunity domain-containing protein [Nocardia sp. NPDC088792]|uniref:colicin immunity domain-containing protein n=1 Tax=Nocardia sp. NPDC088792 TaxID=3364332 RepID=UPI003810A2BE